MIGEFLLKQDDSCHWYLIKLTEEKAFLRWLEESDEENYDGPHFDHRGISGPHNIIIEKYRKRNN